MTANGRGVSARQALLLTHLLLGPSPTGGDQGEAEERRGRQCLLGAVEGQAGGRLGAVTVRL